ncbi:MAG: iron-sulfur cluster assembly scaffold protein [Gammaproteobacteria bacterium]
MQYSTAVWDYFENPRHVGKLDPDDPRVGGALVGTVGQGGALSLQIQVNAQGVIEQARFKAYGCGVTIATAAWVAEWLHGKHLTEALRLADSDICQALELAPAKLHCAVRAVRAVRAAIANYEAKRQALAVECDKD